MTNDLVSVIIPMYNSEKYIKKTLTSILKQTYHNIEIIVVDDGSSDKSKNIVENLVNYYGKEKIKYFYQENKGVSIARNEGILKSNGKYLAFIDSDDLWVKDKIEKQIDRMKISKMKACYCGFTNWYQDKGISKSDDIVFKEGYILENILNGETWCWTGTWIIEKKVIIDNNIMFEPNCTWGEDVEFFLKIASIIKVCCVKEDLAIYRIRKESITTSSDRIMFIRDIYPWERLAKWIIKNSNIVIVNNIINTINLIYYYIIPRSIIYNVYIELFKSNKKISQYNLGLIKGYMKNPYIKKIKFIYGHNIEILKLHIKLILIKIKLCDPRLERLK